MIPTLTATWPLADCSPALGPKDFETLVTSYKWKWNESPKEHQKAPGRQLAVNHPGWGSAARVLDSLISSKCLNSAQLDTSLSPSLSSDILSSSCTSFSTPSSCTSISTPWSSPASSPSTSFSFSSSTPSIPPFKTKYFEVRASKKKGWGAFAMCDIKAGTIIMKERPLVKATAVTLFQDLEKLSLAQRAEYFALYGWAGTQNYMDKDMNRSMAIFMTNRFEITNTVGGIFLKSSRFNHACHEFRNCTYRYNSVEDCIVFKSLIDIQKGEEITISYSPNPSTLYPNYGFYCDCPACPKPKVAKALADRSRRTW